MQHAPGRRPAGSGDFGASRSQGGLANQFASAVVRFFDDQDPRATSSDTGFGDEPRDGAIHESGDSFGMEFSGQIPEFLPFPEESRKALAEDLPEIYDNPSLSSRNLFRSDVDLDGDGHLDMALLIRLSRSEAAGAVLAYTPKLRFQLSGAFRLAGKFHCEFTRAQDFERCFQVMRTGSGLMHIASFTRVNTHPDATADTHSKVPFRWRLFRLVDGELRKTGKIDEACAPNSGNHLRPVGAVDNDLLIHRTACPTPRCQVWRYRQPGLDAALDPDHPGAREPEILGDDQQQGSSRADGFWELAPGAEIHCEDD